MIFIVDTLYITIKTMSILSSSVLLAVSGSGTNGMKVIVMAITCI